ncbi:Clp family protein [Streptomyces sp. NBRC 110611]|uniref:B12-binding domain-containing radical SAM protein n=1 Tax=Streptomyces sp. NBRC 110611 TaxID=1621259 RepID=UPI000856B5EF|nr:cobalamin-dependent protein [Streptomyces sp. NBRC 110611]GAU71126.1 Clp family protein [Streptomyces sp. NBRC 110611]
MTEERTMTLQARRLAYALRLVNPSLHPHDGAIATLEPLLINPNQVRGWLEEHCTPYAGRVHVTGTLDRRLVFAERPDGRWVVADLSGQPHHQRAWPVWAHAHMDLESAHEWLSLADLAPEALYRLSRPRVLLAALYHPEYFPLPRFPLGISDVARAARACLMGEVELADMQLGITLPDLVKHITDEPPDILGISATFGQHDLMIELLDATYALAKPPLVVAGGSLTARNEALLLERYPDLLIARGAGESTVQDLLAHWHGDLAKEHVHSIGYNGAARGEGTLTVRRRRTAKPVSRAQSDFLPELDLLPATFAHHGVAQLEASRGCTNFCSFCPRGHKGQWAGGTPSDFGWMLDSMSSVFDRYPDISRTLYLVDEEFIGRGPDAVTRALHMADVLNGAGFKWETSCRIDQVTHPDRDFAWHVERAALWRSLVNKGLRRCLFGVESGVDTILKRFNKETGGEQNALAIRTLSALGVPTRFTYITFDHLMTFEELKATYAYQGRTDLLVRPLPDQPVEEIVNGVRDPEWVEAHGTGRPFHTGISYMLVSMECLIGAAYTKQVERAGLAGPVRPSMGRQDAEFADWRIGVCSQWAQLWVDRNFALDYTLKPLEIRAAARVARRLLPRYQRALIEVFDNALSQPEPPHRPAPPQVSQVVTLTWYDDGALGVPYASVPEEARMPLYAHGFQYHPHQAAFLLPAAYGDIGRALRIQAVAQQLAAQGIGVNLRHSPAAPAAAQPALTAKPAIGPAVRSPTSSALHR